MKRWKSYFKGGIAAALGIGMVSSAPAAEPITERERQAVSPYDLGPDVIDVSAYPKTHQENYQMFLQKCGACHTPARAINAPLKSRWDWNRFVSRMHGRFESAHQTPAWKKEEGRQIVDFLVYDASIRKVQNRDAFEGHLKNLRARFQEVQRAKAQQSDPSKPNAPYTGTP